MNSETLSKYSSKTLPSLSWRLDIITGSRAWKGWKVMIRAKWFANRLNILNSSRLVWKLNSVHSKTQSMKFINGSYPTPISSEPILNWFWESIFVWPRTGTGTGTAVWVMLWKRVYCWNKKIPIYSPIELKSFPNTSLAWCSRLGIANFLYLYGRNTYTNCFWMYWSNCGSMAWMNWLKSPTIPTNSFQTSYCSGLKIQTRLNGSSLTKLLLLWVLLLGLLITFWSGLKPTLVLYGTDP